MSLDILYYIIYNLDIIIYNTCLNILYIVIYRLAIVCYNTLFKEGWNEYLAMGNKSKFN